MKINTRQAVPETWPRINWRAIIDRSRKTIKEVWKWVCFLVWLPTLPWQIWKASEQVMYAISPSKWKDKEGVNSDVHFGDIGSLPPSTVSGRSVDSGGRM